MEKYYYTHKLIADHVALLLCRNGYSANIVHIDRQWCLATDAPMQRVIDAAPIAVL